MENKNKFNSIKKHYIFVLIQYNHVCLSHHCGTFSNKKMILKCSCSLYFHKPLVQPVNESRSYFHKPLVEPANETYMLYTTLIYYYYCKVKHTYTHMNVIRHILLFNMNVIRLIPKVVAQIPFLRFFFLQGI